MYNAYSLFTSFTKAIFNILIKVCYYDTCYNSEGYKEYLEVQVQPIGKMCRGVEIIRGAGIQSAIFPRACCTRNFRRWDWGWGRGLKFSMYLQCKYFLHAAMMLLLRIQ